MRRYFLLEGANRVGPLSAEELGARPLTPQTPIWHPGLADWSAAGTVPEVAALLQKALTTPAPAVPAAAPLPSIDLSARKPPVATLVPADWQRVRHAGYLLYWLTGVAAISLGLLILGESWKKPAYLFSCSAVAAMSVLVARATGKSPWGWGVVGLIPVLGVFSAALLQQKVIKLLRPYGVRNGFLGPVIPPLPPAAFSKFPP